MSNTTIPDTMIDPSLTFNSPYPNFYTTNATSPYTTPYNTTFPHTTSPPTTSYYPNINSSPPTFYYTTSSPYINSSPPSSINSSPPSLHNNSPYVANASYRTNFAFATNPAFSGVNVTSGFNFDRSMPVNPNIGFNCAPQFMPRFLYAPGSALCTPFVTTSPSIEQDGEDIDMMDDDEEDSDDDSEEDTEEDTDNDVEDDDEDEVMVGYHEVTDKKRKLVWDWRLGKNRKPNVNDLFAQYVKDIIHTSFTTEPTIHELNKLRHLFVNPNSYVPRFLPKLLAPKPRDPKILNEHAEKWECLPILNSMLRAACLPEVQYPVFSILECRLCGTRTLMTYEPEHQMYCGACFHHFYTETDLTEEGIEERAARRSDFTYATLVTYNFLLKCFYCDSFRMVSQMEDDPMWEDPEIWNCGKCHAPVDGTWKIIWSTTRFNLVKNNMIRDDGLVDAGYGWDPVHEDEKERLVEELEEHEDWRFSKIDYDDPSGN